MRVIDFMPPRGQAPDIVRIVEGIRGSVLMRSELVIRFDYGRIVPWVRRIDDTRAGVAGPDAICLRTPVDVHGEDLTTVSEFHASRAKRVPFVSPGFRPTNRCRTRWMRRSRGRKRNSYWTGMGSTVCSYNGGIMTTKSSNLCSS